VFFKVQNSPRGLLQNPLDLRGRLVLLFTFEMHLITFVVLYISVRSSAAKALGEVCRVAAPYIAAGKALHQVFGVYELALSGTDRIEVTSRLAFVEGLAAIASSLPPADATAALKTITFAPLRTVKALAEMRVWLFKALDNPVQFFEQFHVEQLKKSNGCRDMYLV
jgi:hypothetical protein